MARVNDGLIIMEVKRKQILRFVRRFNDMSEYSSSKQQIIDEILLRNVK